MSFHFVNYWFKFLTSQALCLALDFHNLLTISSLSQLLLTIFYEVCSTCSQLNGDTSPGFKKKKKVHDLNHCAYTHFPFGFTAKIIRRFHFQAIKRNSLGFHQRPLIQTLGSETISSPIPPTSVWKFLVQTIPKLKSLCPNFKRNFNETAYTVLTFYKI